MSNCDAERIPVAWVDGVEHSTGGQEVPAVQADLARHSETTGAAGVSSGTEALVTAARALGVGAGPVMVLRGGA